MPNNFNTEAKQLIRSQWGKPLLAFLSKTLGNKLIYMGLPSEDPKDVYEWIDYLDEVYAFQCREYPKPSEENQSREKVVELERKLRELETKGQLSYSVVFDGYMEEVLLKGKDNNPEPIEFGHEDTITVYNLDFCNQISSPQTYYTQDGKERKVYKFKIIKELLNHQEKANQLPKKFILFLNVNTQFRDNHIDKKMESIFPDYIKNVRRLGGIASKARLLNAYVCKIISEAFHYHGFYIEILPTIRYEGNGEFEMSHFTIVGTFEAQTSGGIIQSINFDRLFKRKFLGVKNEQFAPIEESFNLETSNPNYDPVAALKKTKTYKNIWKDNIVKE